MTIQPDGPIRGDAFGEAVLAFHEHGDRTDHHIVERDDGWLDPIPTAEYFPPRAEWSLLDRDALELARGAVLDIGAGAGRHALALQERGFDVTALDVSPGAVEACRRRGARDTFLGTVDDLAGQRAAAYDTFLLMGNNLGLLENRDHAPGFLGALARLAKPGAQILGIGIDPYETSDPDHLAYHERNRRRGRMPGQIGLRIRYRNLTTDWRDYLLVSREELEGLLDGTGWRFRDRIVEGPLYLAVLVTQ